MRFFIFALLSTLAVDGCFCEDLFDSIIGREKLLQGIDGLTSAIDNYIFFEIKRIEKLKRISSDLKNNEVLPNLTDLTHPIQAYLMIKHMTNGWKHAILRGSKKSAEEFKGKVKPLGLPSLKEKQKTIEAILILQETYSLSVKSLSLGNINNETDHHSEVMLNACDCFAFGRRAHADKKFDLAESWFRRTLELMEVGEVTECRLNRVRVLEFVAFAVLKQGRVQNALSITEKMIELSPDNSRAVASLASLKRLAASGDSRRVAAKSQRTGWYGSDEFNRYKKLCRGDNSVLTNQTIVQPVLLCRYRVPHEFFRLAPIREEVANWRPLIVMWHSVLTDSDIRQVKRLATPKLKRSGIRGRRFGKNIPASYRISKSAWLSSTEYELTAKLNKRIELMTGLSVDSAEELQVANYGLGGHYEPHYDFFANSNTADSEQTVWINNRIATLLFYLSDVEAGGATVFNKLDVRLLPREGSAAFWYNLRRSGSLDKRTLHAACPVLHGSKWVMNKWLHEAEQEFRRPCGLNEDD